VTISRQAMLCAGAGFAAAGAAGAGDDGLREADDMPGMYWLGLPG